jgi:hypothetical protein
MHSTFLSPKKYLAAASNNAPIERLGVFRFETSWWEVGGGNFLAEKLDLASVVPTFSPGKRRKDGAREVCFWSGPVASVEACDAGEIELASLNTRRRLLRAVDNVRFSPDHHFRF